MPLVSFSFAWVLNYRPIEMLAIFIYGCSPGKLINLFCSALTGGGALKNNNYKKIKKEF
jgi:hypothetical protein